MSARQVCVQAIAGLVMNPKFVSLLCCPKTGSDLTLEVDELFADQTIRSGTLVSAREGHRYPIINGIPRFVAREHYASSFGYEWRKWPRLQFESQNAGRPTAGHTSRMFEAITGLRPDDLAGKLVVEFGCGPGRFLDLVRRGGATAVGIDMSAAVEVARENFHGDGDVLIVQGDIVHPPFRTESFGVGYTIGVLHHTPNPERGLEALARVVKRGGLVACCVYPKHSFYDFPSVRFYRRMHQFVRSLGAAGLARRLALGYSYFAAYGLYPLFAVLRRIPVIRRLVSYLEKYACVCVNIPDGRWRVLDVFDAITPAFASTHTADEVAGWFRAAGCEGIRQTPWCPTSFVGTRGA
jgi:SAM-dependent methyltransferase